VIAFATHAALLARRDIVDVLHLSGARDRFIASLFERRFWVLGLRAGAVGALLALGAAAAAIFAAKAHGGHAGLLPELSLDYLDLVVLVLTPVIAGLAARIAARVTVIRALKSMM
jgi:cell division transport system permease protein